MFSDVQGDSPIKEKINTYACFAMDHDCHDMKNNDKYIFTEPQIDSLSRYSFERNIESFNSKRTIYDLTKNRIDQHMIEEIFFNVLQKMNKKASFNEVYDAITEMTRESHNTQKKLGFVNGYIKSPETKLKKEKGLVAFSSKFIIHCFGYFLIILPPFPKEIS